MFEKRCIEGLKSKVKRGLILRPEIGRYEEQIRHEIDISNKIGILNHFHFAKELTDFARKSGLFYKWEACFILPSLIAYCLDITEIDPVANGFVFELYANPERISCPDLQMRTSTSGKYKIFSYILSEFSKNTGGEIEITKDKLVLSNYTPDIDSEKASDIIVHCINSQFIEFIEKHSGRKMNMPENYSEIASETGGSFLYYEQILLFLAETFKISLAQADLLRRDIKRLSRDSTTPEEIQKHSFLDRSEIPEEQMTYIFFRLAEDILFCRSKSYFSIKIN